MKRIFILLMVFIFVFTLIGCKSNEVSQPVPDDETAQAEEPSNDEQLEQSNREEQAEDNKPEETEPKFIAPLTGLPSDFEINNRIIGIMVNNHNKARPQTGLNEADIVYEFLTEGMITRFVAFYQSKIPDVIGPVRSIRPYFIDLINGFDAIIVHAGGSYQAYDILQESSLPDLDEIKNAGEVFWRESFRIAPHNLYTSIEKIRKGAKKRGFRSEGYIPTISFLDKDDKVDGKKAEAITVNYDKNYIVTYKYDEASKLYYRSINGEPHTDFETRLQLTAKNVLVIRAKHKVLDSEGRRAINIDGPGKGLLFQNGVTREITWQRKDGVIRPYINGEEQGLYPGQTWVIVVQNDTDVSYK